MSSVDNRIVRMVFDNSRFKAAASETKASLDNVTQSIKNAGSGKGLLDLQKGMDGVAIKASKMQIAVGTAIGTIANKATNAGLNLAKSLTIAPILGGFKEYEALLNKQNTIMNSTGKSAKVVKAVLTDLNDYSDKTIFKFSDMTDAITQFTNAGIPLGQAETSIRGIANAAAFAGLSSEKAGSAFYAFSQSMSTGYLMLQDFNQLGNAGFATTRFKQEVLDAAVSVGTLTKTTKGYKTESGKLVTVKNFRNELNTQFATTEVLNKALEGYADTTGKLGKKAFESATEIRTFTAFMDTLKESIESGWASVFGAVFGGLEESTAMWTKLGGAVGGVIQGFFSFLTSSITVWREMGGASKIMQGFLNILAPFGAIFGAIGEAFKTAFGGEGGKGVGSTLYGISVAFELLTRPLALLAKLIEQMVHPLTLFFQIIRLGGLVIGEVIGFVVDFVKGIFDLASFKVPSGGGLLGYIKDLYSAISTAVKEVSDLISKGKSITEAFNNVSIKFPKLPDLGGFKLPKVGGFDLGGIFGGGGNDGPAGTLETISTKTTALTSNFGNLHDSAQTVAKGALFKSGQGIEKASTTFSAFSENMVRDVTPSVEKASTTFSAFSENMGRSVAPTMEKTSESLALVSNSMDSGVEAGSSFVDVVKNIVGAIGDFFGKIQGEDVVSGLNLAVLATMGITFARFISSFGGIMRTIKSIGDAARGVLESTSGAIDEFASSRKRESQAKLIMAIAIALGILAVSLFILSKIPKDKLVQALKALGAVMIGFSAVMFILTKAVNKLDGDRVIGKLLALGFAMVGIGLGILLLATAMRVMNGVGLPAVLKTLITLQVIFANLIIIGTLAEKSGRKFVAAAAAMVIIGGAMLILAVAIKAFALIKPEEMIKAGIGLAALTASIYLLAKLPAASLFTAGVAMIAVATAMSILVVALLLFALVKWESIAKAGVTLLILTVSLILLSGFGATGAPVIIAIAAAMVAIALACLVLQKVSWETIGKAAAVLGILVLTFALFMGVVYLAAPVIPLLTGLALGLAALAGGIALLVTAVALILPILALGVGAFAAFATGAAVAIAVFLQTLALEAPNIKKSVIKILQVFIDGIVESIPIIIDGVKRMIKAVWDQFTSPDTGSQIGEKGKSMWEKFKELIAEWTPKIVEAVKNLIMALVDKIRENADNFALAAVDLIISLIEGIASKAEDLVKAAVNLMITFIEAIGDQAKPVTEAGLQLVIDLINGMADGIRGKSEGIGESITNLIDACVTLGENMVEGLGEGIGRAGRSLVTSPVRVFKAVVRGVIEEGGKEEADARSPSRKTFSLGVFLAQGLTLGIQSQAANAINAVAVMVSGQIAIANSYISSFVQRLDQQAIAARAKAEGLAKSAELAMQAADRAAEKAQDTKGKKDDKAAEQQKKDAEELSDKADRGTTSADKIQDQADRAREEADRQRTFEQANTLEKARLRSEDAQRKLDEAKVAEEQAAKDIAKARAIEKAVKSGDFTKKEAEKLLKEAKELRDDAAKLANQTNDLIRQAKENAAQALELQRQAGAEAAASFQRQFDAEAKEDADRLAFDALTDAQKVLQLQADAARLSEAAKADLEAAKRLAYTDIEAANDLASQANEQADRARDMMEQAADLQKSIAEAATAEAERLAQEEANKKNAPVNIPITGTTSVDLTASDAAAAAFNAYSELYSSASAAAAAPTTIQFAQYNTSPESLTPTEIYRQTNNLLTHASDKLGQAA